MDEDDLRPVDQNMGPVRYRGEMAVMSVDSGFNLFVESTPIGSWFTTTSGLCTTDLTHEYVVYADAQWFAHLVAPRNTVGNTLGALTSPQTIENERITQAMRSVSAVHTNRYEIEGTYHALVQLASRWAHENRTNANLLIKPMSFFGDVLLPAWTCLVDPILEELTTKVVRVGWDKLLGSGNGLGCGLVFRVAYGWLESIVHFGLPTQSVWLPHLFHTMKHLLLAIVTLKAGVGYGVAMHILHNLVATLLAARTMAFLFGYAGERAPGLIGTEMKLLYQINRRATSRVQQPMAVSIGPMVMATYPRPDVGSMNNVIRAASGRIATVAPVIGPVQLRELHMVSTWLAASLTPISPSHDFDFEEWLEHTKYPSERKAQLRVAWEKSHEGMSRDKRMERVKLHLKDEPYETYKIPRAILARVDQAKDLMGPLFHEIEKTVFAQEEFVKTVPVADRPKFLAEKFGTHCDRDKLLMESDISRMESHFISDVIVAMELPLYNRMVSNNPRGVLLLIEAMRILCGDNTITWRDTVSFMIHARRCSGEMNTSLGNGWGTLVMTHAVFARKHGVLSRLNMVCEGDDALVVVDTTLGVPDAQDFMHYGFKAKLEMRPSIFRSRFCGIMMSETVMRPLYSPEKFLLTIGWSKFRHVNFGLKKRLALLRVKCMSFASMFPSCPVIWAYCSNVIRKTSHVSGVVTLLIQRGHFDSWELEKFATNGLSEVVFEPTMEERILCEEEFGMPIEHQLIYEKWFSDCDLDAVFPYLGDSEDAQDYYTNYVMQSHTPAFQHDQETAICIQGQRLGFFQLSMVAALTDHLPHAAARAGQFLACKVKKPQHPFPFHFQNNGPESILMHGKNTNRNDKNKSRQVEALRHVAIRLSQGNPDKFKALREFVQRFHSGHPVRRAAADTITAVTGGKSTETPRPGGSGTKVPVEKGRRQRLGPDNRGSIRSMEWGQVSSQRLGSEPRSSREIFHLSNRTAKIKVNGKVHSTLTLHPNKSSFQRAVALASGSTNHGSEVHQTEWASENGRHVRLYGHQYLTSLASLSGTALLVGEHLPGGIFPIEPEALGGILELISAGYEQHKVHSLGIEFRSSCPATTAGSLGMFFDADVDSEWMEAGEPAVARASTHQFIDGPVWEDKKLNIDPKSAYGAYFDSMSGQQRLSAQGSVHVLATSALAADVPFGNLYLTYDYEFLSPAIDQDVLPRQEVILTNTCGATMNSSEDNPVMGTVDSVSANDAQLNVNFVGAAAALVKTDYVYILTLNSVSGNWLAGAFNVRTDNGIDDYTFTAGTVLYGRIVDNIGTEYLYLFTTLSAAVSQDPDVNNPVSNDQLAWQSNSIAAGASGDCVYTGWAVSLR
jgi:hypothetical protein